MPTNNEVNQETPNNINIEQEEQSPPTPSHTIDNSEISQRLEQIINEIKEDRRIREELKNKEQKEKENELKEKQKLEKIDKEKEEKALEEKQQFLEDFKTIVDNSTLSTDTTFQETVSQKMDELIFLKKMDFMSVGLFVSISLVVIYQLSFKR